MPAYRFTVQDPMNEWVHAVEIEAADPDQARRRAESWLFARVNVGGKLVRLELEDR